MQAEKRESKDTESLPVAPAVANDIEDGKVKRYKKRGKCKTRKKKKEKTRRGEKENTKQKAVFKLPQISADGSYGETEN